jgi:hypothetical protein
MNTAEQDSNSNKNSLIKDHISNLWEHMYITPRDLMSLLKMGLKDQEYEILSKLFFRYSHISNQEHKADRVVYGLRKCKSAIKDLSAFIPSEVAGFLMEINIEIISWEKYLQTLWWESQGIAKSSPEFVSLVEKIKQLEEMISTAIETSTLPPEARN